ncbi:cell wall metabolism sensor histidine kinase WalK [Fructilactobacillus fructivorans]|uniref:histidine kinase n=1 Tax=Fructilactobacillus fructivorans TaxID=1614 RepID=A0AAE6P0I2_9LACO|nr:cell wall metabolism sensor histidine kinase WalK [Fructilactobacillus fructivorans]KRK58068.1 multi-sensor signal transduction histidine kinase [Fructilactobacillus fructivorans]MCT0150954.1 cell wall metabolism sensor histidine kinase WalK [Fructilactobacillus fructivorans]MCT2867489.1 cell wall metabolism sensor histidine kinase WalK [Fructilactobacillus fructivorans]MCT2868993.1 cell wall metabolism sensor histidine kinase WalK [Fructilactobacillus fructivorans]MCT2873288.1 cell wall me
MKKKRRWHFLRSIHFKIALVFALMMIITLEVVGAVFVRQLEYQNLNTFKDSIQLKPYVNTSLKKQLAKKNQTDANKQIQTILEDVDTNNSDDILVVDSRGNIRGTNQSSDQSLVGQKTTDNDIKNALNNGKTIEKNTYSDGNRYYTMITPLINSQGNENNMEGVVYVRANLNPVYQNINSITLIYLFAAIVAIILGLLLTFIISRAITKPIDAMKKQTEQIARGNYSGHVKVYGNDELGQLARAVNNLSVRVEESQESTESERRRLDSVLDNMTDGVVATDRRGNVIIINDEALSFLGVTKQQVIGKSILDVLHLRDRFTLKDLIEDPGQVNLDFSDRDHKLILSAHFSLIQRESGFINGLVCVFHDITLQQKIDDDRKQFVSNVSHELRTPLTSVHSYIEALQDGAWKDKDLAPKFLKVTQDETDRMTRMINDLLTLSRMDSGTQKYDTELVNMNKLFNYILDRFDMIIKTDDNPKKKYSIKRDFTKQDLWAEIDTDRFTQVIDNIMNNAIKYSPDGGVITCRIYEQKNRIIMSISDQGLGMPKKAIKHIFDRFYRVDKARSRAQGGSGLGLAISKEIVEAFGGHIWVDSVEGKGSTFYISLPNEPVEEDLWDEGEA